MRTGIQRQRLLVRGVIQGVGFRPFVHALARRHRLTGFVGNDSSGVFIEVQGEARSLDAFRADLVAHPPPLARVEAVHAEAMPPCTEHAFEIVESEPRPGVGTPVSPDIAPCDDCLRELFDPTDRRYRYPFINCTNCGPRYTITRDTPYDRALTTMAAFRMCPACEGEYRDPANRRFHAQPNACPRCGPAVRFVGTRTAVGDDAIHLAREALGRGEIVAVKGVGGFHLACDAGNDEAVRRLRERKGRGDKPFAVMVRDLEAARRRAWVDDAEARLLAGRERPIVLLRRRDDAPLSTLVAPGNASLGLMLPYSPLHHLLVGDGPIVLTSGNRSDEPIVREDEEALRTLAGLADAFLLHDREIHAVCDDSVVRGIDGREYPVRRSRGYAPMPIRLPHGVRSVVAVGGELKATFCLTKGGYAYVGPHIGDMGSLETLQAFERALAHFQNLFRVGPERVVCDLHPGYISSRWAAAHASERGLPLQPVQHHHAHVASVLAENGRLDSGPVIGVCFDGTGYGTDGAIWGGEVLVATCASFRRAAHLKYVALPGGDAAIKRPYRVALAHLRAAGVPWSPELPCVAACPEVERRVLERQLTTGLNCVPTSSMGRLFDAVAALIGVRQTITYEAQGAIEMEALVDEGGDGSYPFLLAEGEPITVDPSDVVRGVVEDVRRGAAAGAIAARFHRAVADLIVELAVRVRERTGIGTVALSGGVFQNVTLTRQATRLLREAAFEVLTHRLVPPNDGGLALGQAAIACATL